MIDCQCLTKYNERNQHVSMEVVTIIEEEERFVGYNCIYRYETHEVQLEYDISTEMWTILSDKCHLAEQKKIKHINRTCQ